MLEKIITWGAFLYIMFIAVFWLLVYLEKGIQEFPRKKISKNNLPEVTIAIPAYNEENSIAGTIQSVLNLDYPENKLKIIVINDGSTDRTKEIVEQLAKTHKSITLINQHNQGKGVALNTALKYAGTEYFISMDADSFVKSDALQKLLSYFTDEKVGVVMPIMKVKNPKTLMQKIQHVEYLFSFFLKTLMGQRNAIHVAPGPFSVYKTEIIKTLGGYDEHNLTEDMELTLRLQKHHYKVIQVHDTEVATIAPDTFKKFYIQRNRWGKGAILNAFKYRNLMFKKEYGDFGLLQLPAVLIAGPVFVISFFIITYRTFQPLFSNLSYFSFVRLPTMLKSINLDFRFIDINAMNAFFLLAMLFITLLIIVKGHKYSKERIFKYGFFSIISYFVLYYICSAVIWIGIMKDILTGRVQKW